MNTEAVIAQHMPDVRIARRKGVKVRLQNIRTAKMGPWVTDPFAVQERQRTQYASMRERMNRLPVIHAESTLSAMTNARIREVGHRVLGLTFPSKARKADMVAAYLAEQSERIA